MTGIATWRETIGTTEVVFTAESIAGGAVFRFQFTSACVSIKSEPFSSPVDCRYAGIEWVKRMAPFSQVERED